MGRRARTAQQEKAVECAPLSRRPPSSDFEGGRGRGADWEAAWAAEVVALTAIVLKERGEQKEVALAVQLRERRRVEDAQPLHVPIREPEFRRKVAE